MGVFVLLILHPAFLGGRGGEGERWFFCGFFFFFEGERWVLLFFSLFFFFEGERDLFFWFFFSILFLCVGFLSLRGSGGCFYLLIIFFEGERRVRGFYA